MAKDILVTPEQLETTAARIEALSTEYKSTYDDLYAKNDAMAVTWGGKDNVAYIQQIAGFKDDFQKMKDLMDDYARFLRTSAKSYRDTQQQIADEAKKLKN